MSLLMSSENSKPNNSHRNVLNLRDKTDLNLKNNTQTYTFLSNPSIYYK